MPTNNVVPLLTFMTELAVLGVFSVNNIVLPRFEIWHSGNFFLPDRKVQQKIKNRSICQLPVPGKLRILQQAMSSVVCGHIL